MKVAFFSTKNYDRRSFDAVPSEHELVFHEPRLTPATMTLATWPTCPFCTTMQRIRNWIARHGTRARRADGRAKIAIERAPNQGPILALPKGMGCETSVLGTVAALGSCGDPLLKAGPKSY